MATTAGDIITASFLKVGVEVPTTAQTASALISLNNMMSLLGADMLAPVVTRASFAMTIGDAEYTIGDGGDFDTDYRPMQITSCFLRDSDNYDYPVSIMGARDYAAISDKSTDVRPSHVYFVPEYPLPKLIFSSCIATAHDVHLEWLANFTEFTATTTSFALPPEYKECLVYNLAVSLGEDWQREVTKTVYAQAMRTRDVVDRLNAAARTVPKARFDVGPSLGLGDYSIVTDSVIDGGAF